MRSQTLLVLVLATVFAGIAGVGVYFFLIKDKDKVDGSPMVIVTADVPRGETLSPDSIEVRNYPKDAIPPGILTSAEEAIGRTVLTPLVQGEPLLDSKLASTGSGRGLASLIKKGMRAMAVQTPNVATGVAGFIAPGNRVDVLLTFNDSGRDEKGGAGAVTLLENVEILAVDQSVDAPAKNRVDGAQMRSVTLSVTPEQATKLTLGQNRGVIHLSLRNSTDSGRTSNRPSSLADLQGGISWDVRARGLLQEWTRLAASRRPVSAPTPVPAVAEGPAPPPRAPASRAIRAIRGAQEQIIQMEHSTGPRVTSR